MASERPNILFITSDQQRRDCYGFRGRNIQTPHRDILASEGTSLEAVISRPAWSASQRVRQF